MNSFSEAGVYLVQTIGHIYLSIIVVRFLLQASKADFNNPVSRFLIRATHKPTTPIRKLVPTYKTFDMATVVLAIIFQCMIIQLSATIAGLSLLPILYLISWAAIGIFSLVLYIYLYGLLIIIIMSWIAPNSYHPIVILLQQLMTPITRPIQRLLPDMGGLDFSPIIVFIVINILRIFLGNTAAAMRLPQLLVPGI